NNVAADNTIIIGSGSTETSTAPNGIIIGTEASNSRNSAIVLGEGASNAGDFGIVMGVNASSANADNVVIGTQAVAGPDATSSVLLGGNTQTDDPFVVAVGGRRIEQIGDGINPHDAVAMEQMDAALGYVASGYGGGASWSNGLWQYPTYALREGT